MAPDPGPDGDDFTARVLAVVAGLPPGTLLTYGEVAAEAGSPGAARAVGTVMARFGDQVPWWRVVPASGRLSAALVARQQTALRREGIVVENGRIRQR